MERRKISPDFLLAAFCKHTQSAGEKWNMLRKKAHTYLKASYGLEGSQEGIEERAIRGRRCVQLKMKSWKVQKRNGNEMRLIRWNMSLNG
jgi:hypothetical protein